MYQGIRSHFSQVAVSGKQLFHRLIWWRCVFKPKFEPAISSFAPLVYVLARAYLIVECFVALSNSPVGIYDVPAWSSYFPHIS